MTSVLDEIGALVRTRPGVDATDAEVAAWYRRKAAMLLHAHGELPADRGAEWSAQAAKHAAALVGGIPWQGTGSDRWSLMLGEAA